MRGRILGSVSRTAYTTAALRLAGGQGPPGLGEAQPQLETWAGVYIGSAN
ncbi:hypothetical protein [Streptomyces griseoruber]|nr:hypothetical protein [Streptomyces griseoruber]